jgi:N-acetylglucosaminyl-diphospho-decaprenol L-rhamnosyltransferase
VTCNVTEDLGIEEDHLVQVVENPRPNGFGANHDAAFRECHEQYFCVVNPDIKLQGDPFPELQNSLEEHGAAIAAPLILSPQGKVEDSVRYFPSLRSLLLKATGLSDGRYPVPPDKAAFFPDWVAGMFMLFRSSDFARLGGFDERYFLYYEDVDICARARAAGMNVVVCPTVSTIHDARRASRRSFRHMRWHMASMARYLWTARKLGR